MDDSAKAEAALQHLCEAATSVRSGEYFLVSPSGVEHHKPGYPKEFNDQAKALPEACNRNA